MNLDMETIKKHIWEHPGITTYELLAHCVEQGYTYEKHGKNSFPDFLNNLKNESDINYDRAHDAFYRKQYMLVRVPIESESTRRNCYNCDFACNVKDNPIVRENVPPEHNIYCALDPSIHMLRSMQMPRHIICPYNAALRQFLQEKFKEKNP